MHQIDAAQPDGEPTSLIGVGRSSGPIGLAVFQFALCCRAGGKGKISDGPLFAARPCCEINARKIGESLGIFFLASWREFGEINRGKPLPTPGKYSRRSSRFAARAL